jgi:sarcosine oxidase, subunit gamma
VFEPAVMNDSGNGLGVVSTQGLPFTAAGQIEINALPACGRVLLRGAEAARATASAVLTEAFGIDLPLIACRSARQGDYAALWLGPEEWLVLAPVAELGKAGAILRRALHGTADALVPHALVPHALIDVSDRQIAFTVSGPLAADVLNTGCPLDLGSDAFPVGMCTRTLMAKVEVIVWRLSPDSFRVECQRSFSAYLITTLVEASRSIAA